MTDHAKEALGYLALTGTAQGVDGIEYNTGAIAHALLAVRDELALSNRLRFEEICTDRSAQERRDAAEWLGVTDRGWA